jgi:N-glycosylase/DNA lyase
VTRILPTFTSVSAECNSSAVPRSPVGSPTESEEVLFPTRHYDLKATLTSGQAFGWNETTEGWTGVVLGRWVRLRQVSEGILAQAATPQADWCWLAEYLQVDVNLQEILTTFPEDPQLAGAVAAFPGLRLLRQDPWECLASFILSSTKQIVQIRRIVAELRARFGMPVNTREPTPAFSFPDANRLAAASEAELRACKMGFRAPYLLAAARAVASGECDLIALRRLSMDEAQAWLLKLPGVGTKIADCVLLFAYGFSTAFPVDVWVRKALERFYFRGRRVKPARLRSFITSLFGPNAGYAQQYLFHYIRTQGLPGR